MSKKIINIHHSNGEIKSKTHYLNYLNGNGLQTAWYKNGRKSMERTWKDGKMHGMELDWRESGQKWRKAMWRDGKKHGLMIMWHEGGHKRSEIIWRADKQQGTETWWDKSGNKSLEATRRNDKHHGIQTTWYENGDKQWEIYYIEGNEYATISWDERGVITEVKLTTFQKKQNPKLNMKKNDQRKR